MTPPAPIAQSSAHPNANTCAIAVIAKAPRPGHVKTRLQGIVHPDQAAALGAAFLRDTLANLAAAARDAPIAPFVAYAPAGQEARFDGMLPPGTGLLLADGTHGDAPGVDGFGRVLLDTTRTLFARGYGAVCVLGADSPTLPTTLLVQAARLLLDRRADAVLGPADDGGYWLLGLTHPHPEPYANIAWSTATVAAETRHRIAAANLRLAELDTWYDVDDPAALARLVRETTARLVRETTARLVQETTARLVREPTSAAPSKSPAAPFAAPHTTSVLASLGLAARLSEPAAE